MRIIFFIQSILYILPTIVFANSWNIEEFNAAKNNIPSIRVIDEKNKNTIMEYIPGDEQAEAQTNFVLPGSKPQTAEEVLVNTRHLVIVTWNQGVHTKVLTIFDPIKNSNPIFSVSSDQDINYKILNKEIQVQYNQAFLINNDITYAPKKIILKPVAADTP